MVKISEYTTITTLANADLFDLSQYDAVATDYNTKSISWVNFLANITDDLTTITGPIAIGGAVTATDALLDLQATDKAFLPPRLTTAQVAAIGSPVEGMILYNSTLKVNQIYNGSAWVALPAGNNVKAISATPTTLVVGENIASFDTSAVTHVAYLPAANAVAAGYKVICQDTSGDANTRNITVRRQGADTIDGAAEAVITADYGSFECWSDGSAAWYIIKHV
jgi:hypothetical protein